MSRFLVGSVLFAVATLAVLGTGVTNAVVNWFDNLGNSSSEEFVDLGDVAVAAAADDLTPIQRAGSFVRTQDEPDSGPLTLFSPPEELAQVTPESAPAPVAAQTTAPAAATDTSIPALW